MEQIISMERNVAAVVTQKRKRETKQVNEITQPAFDDKRGEGNQPNKFEQETDEG